MQRVFEDGVPQQVSFTDFQSVTRLLGAVAADGLPRLQRIRRVVEGVTQLMDGDVWVWWHGRYGESGRASTTYQVEDGGYESDEQRALFRQWLTLPEMHHHFVLGAVALLRADPLTVSRADVSRNAGREEGRTEILARERSGLGDYMVTFYPLQDGNCTAVGIHRAARKGLFGARERMLLNTVVIELADLHGGGRDSATVAVVSALSPRLRQVLNLVLEGHSRKQIARDLGLSEHTVGGYLKDLHARLNVKSRGELMAHFMSD